MRKQIHLYCTLLLFLLSGASCSDDENEKLLLDAPVQLQVNLKDARYQKLMNMGEYYEFTSKPTSLSYIGVGGILLVHTLSPMEGSSPFAAYDLFCTYEKNVRVEPQKGGIYAICPKCDSKYDISSGIGNCMNGPAKQLRVYSTYYSAINSTVTVTK